MVPWRWRLLRGLSKRQQWSIVLWTSVLANLYLIMRTSRIYKTSIHGTIDDEMNGTKGRFIKHFRSQQRQTHSQTIPSVIVIEDSSPRIDTRMAPSGAVFLPDNGAHHGDHKDRHDLQIDAATLSSSTSTSSPPKSKSSLSPDRTGPTSEGIDIDRAEQQARLHQSRNDSFSFCLLIKDDNAILNEWIAYHFHAWRFRQLIVAIDPSSTTSPKPLLDVWKQHFGLDYELWTDDIYMPEYFLQGMYDRVPRMIKFEDKNATKWQDEEDMAHGNSINLKQHLEQDYTRINNHRYRQAKFLQHCARALQDRNQTWVTHIDSDEYITINPTLIQQQRMLLQRKQADSNGTIAKIDIEQPILVQVPLDWKDGNQNISHGASLLWDFLQDLVKVDREVINWPCISMPRILYGALEDTGRGKPATTPQSFTSVVSMFNVTKFETLRWMYHADYADQESNKQPKVMMDVSGFPVFNVSRRAFSIHRPSMVLCRQRAQTNVYQSNKFPFVVHHYLGSWERYRSRDDPRRTKTIYWEKSRAVQQQLATVGNNKDGFNIDEQWIDGWLTSFVDTYGLAKVIRVLGEYMLNGNQSIENNDGSV